MKKIKFTKMVAAGNDFIVLDRRDQRSNLGSIPLVRTTKVMCDRREGVGADGLLSIEYSRKADFKMRILNPDGSEAEMCGNGLRCVALYSGKKIVSIETRAGIYTAKVTGKARVKVGMEVTGDFRLDYPIDVNGRWIKANYVDAGVPHTVIFVHGIEYIEVEDIGRKIRYHCRFKPRGTNVDFVEIIDDKNIKLRTYERGVEQETMACGTGAVASAIISGLMAEVRPKRVNVYTKGGILRVYFKKTNGKIQEVFLEGQAREVYTGEFNLA